jgi:hypothetical protein
LTKSFFFVFIFVVVTGLLCGLAAADRLPNETPENQVFSMTSSVEAIGSYTGTQSLQWTSDYDPPMFGSPDDIGIDDPVLVNYGGPWDPSMKNFWANYEDMKYDYQNYLQTHPGSTFAQFWASVLVDPEYQGTVTDPSLENAFNAFLNSLTQGRGLHTGILNPNEVRATTAYSEMTQTNGGYVSETKSFDPDSRNKALGLYNVESTKTLTYGTDANTGSIAQTSESITLDVMANSSLTSDVVACPFGPSTSTYFPAFCNVVYAKSMSAGVTSAALSSSAQVRMIAGSADVPAELNYNFDVKPDASSDVGYAMGTFGTEFGVSIKEARGTSMTPSATNVYTDKASIAGMIAKFTKNYAYKSGFRL